MNSGEQVTLIGANGAGKTSSLRALTGLQPFEGEILFDGLSIRGVPPHRLLQQGLVMVPEGRGIFARMTVLENLQLGAYSRSDKPAVRQDMEQVCALFPRLRERLRQQAGLLSGGEQQMVAIGRALLSRPRLLILDEPSMGLAPIVVEAIFEVIKRLPSDGVTLLLVEQNARLALASTDRAYVLDSGNLNHSGRSADLLDDEKIKQAYLGE
ncbi:High-affinity branched-chain amino acid transport ATP-binding protein LivF [compost metagenome]